LDFYYHDTDSGVLVLSADGGLNAQTAEQFVKELEHVIAGGITRLIVDCSKLDYVSSYGVAVLIRLHKHLARLGGDVKLANIHSRVVSLLGMMKVDALFDIYPDVDRARLAFRAPA
jgi:anti-sigma B factor antagonist